MEVQGKILMRTVVCGTLEGVGGDVCDLKIDVRRCVCGMWFCGGARAGRPPESVSYNG